MKQTKPEKTTGNSAAGQRVVIYGLVHPMTGELRYIGKARDMRKRLLSHLSESRTRKRPINCWIAALAKKGLIPEIFEVSTADADQWAEEETHWIAYFRSVGANLLNLADGGDQPKPSKEQLKINAATATAKRDPDIFRMKKFMEAGLRVIRKYGDQGMVERQEARMMLVSTMTREQQKQTAIAIFATPTDEERDRRVKKWRDAQEAHRAKAHEGQTSNQGAANAA